MVCTPDATLRVPPGIVRSSDMLVRLRRLDHHQDNAVLSMGHMQGCPPSGSSVHGYSQWPCIMTAQKFGGRAGRPLRAEVLAVDGGRSSRRMSRHSSKRHRRGQHAGADRRQLHGRHLRSYRRRGRTGGIDISCDADLGANDDGQCPVVSWKSSRYDLPGHISTTRSGSSLRSCAAGGKCRASNAPAR
jgi:hypothetical protein